MHTVEYYLAMKRNDILAHVTTGMNLEAIMLSDRGQSQRATESASPFLWNVQDRQTYRDRRSISGCLRLVEGQDGCGGGV